MNAKSYWSSLESILLGRKGAKLKAASRLMSREANSETNYPYRTAARVSVRGMRDQKYSLSSIRNRTSGCPGLWVLRCFALSSLDCALLCGMSHPPIPFHVKQSGAGSLPFRSCPSLLTYHHYFCAAYGDLRCCVVISNSASL